MRSAGKRGALVLALAFALTSCITPTSAPPQVSRKESAAEALQQRELALRSALGKRLRLANIGFALEKANAPLCPKTRPLYGFGIHARSTYAGKMAKAAMALYGFADRPRISYVIARSPAGNAGLKAGDTVLGLDETSLKAGKKALATFLKALGAKKGRRVILHVRRAGKTLNLPMQAVPVCAIAISRSASPAINARTWPRTIVVNDGMLGFVRNDNELAMVLAHELAHYAMGHVRKEGTNLGAGFAAGLALDLALISVGVFFPGVFSHAGANAGIYVYSADFEREADYVGVYFLVRAGFDATGTENFWRRLGAQYPDAITRRSSHPPTAKRFVALRKTLAEIARKQQHDAPLIPNAKPGRAPLKARPSAKPLPDAAH